MGKQRSARGVVFGISRVTKIRLFSVAWLLACGSVSSAATFPSASGSGFFSYDGSALTLDLGTVVSSVFYSPTEFAFSPFDDPIIATAAELTGVTQVGSSFVFSNGVFTLTVGTEVLLTANIVNVELVPTATHTGDINPGLSAINLENVVVAQPTSGTSRFITDWLTASAGSGRGMLGLTLVNTDAGSLNPLVAPAGGNILFSLEPTNVSGAVPADRDGDGDVDGIDFGVFASCFNEAGKAPRTVGCDANSQAALDFDHDGDIDGVDFGKFAACFNMAGNPPRTVGCPQN